MSGAGAGWLNRSTVGVSLASFFSDVSHELATAVLPAVLLSLGAGAGMLGIIEGSADGLSALAKLWGGIQADRVQRRKPLAAVGYLVTAVAHRGHRRLHAGLAGAAVPRLGVDRPGQPQRLARRAHVRGVAAVAVGKAFGMERAADAAGAVIGPLLALVLLSRRGPRRAT